MKQLEILNMMDIKEHQQVWFINGLTKKNRLGVSLNEKLAEELHKPVNKKFKKRRVHARFIDNIWTVDLAEMGSLSSKNQNVKQMCDRCFY